MKPIRLCQCLSEGFSRWGRWTPVGKSVARFIAPGLVQEQVLAMATAFANEMALHVESAGPDHVLLTKGSIWWTGKRLLTILASNVPEGAHVQVEAWVEGIVDLNANPNEFVGMVPRRDAWRLASAFVSRFGIVPEAVFQHF